MIVVVYVEEPVAVCHIMEPLLNFDPQQVEHLLLLTSSIWVGARRVLEIIS